MRTIALVAALGAALLCALPASADDGDSATLTRRITEIGQQMTVTLEVVTPPGASVELDPGAASWGDVEVARIESQSLQAEGDMVRHRLSVVVAAFALGEVQFQPAVNVITGVESTQRLLPTVSVEVTSTLPEGAPLELSPLPPTSAISGAESPLLRPALALIGVAAIALLGTATFLGARRLTSRPSPFPAAGAGGPPQPDLTAAAALLAADPVAGYRALASAVRRHVGERYGFPATALTSGELERRMEREGVDRWEARLVGGLLENCDAVVYAGYRPAPERREADLTMAREIVGVDS